jgi:acyl carrier protein
MRFKFDKPTGSQADTKELEYVALLPLSLLGCFAFFERPIMHGRHYNSQTNTVRSSLIEIISSKRYIAALMQTCRPMRQDGSIEGMCKFALVPPIFPNLVAHDDDDNDYDSMTVQDIMYFLMSRYGVEVKEDALRIDIFKDLAGNPDNATNGIIDIRQLVAMLVIPHLAKIAHGVYTDSMTKDGSSEIADSRLGEASNPREARELLWSSMTAPSKC